MASQDDFESQADRPSLAKQHLSAAIVTALEEKENDATTTAGGPPLSKEAMLQITELVWDWTTTALAPDLEAFMRHSKRSIIGVEDVQLAARKNVRTRQLIDGEASRLKEHKQAAREAKARRVAGDD